MLGSFLKILLKRAWFEVPAAVIMTIQAFWNVMPCRLANSLTGSSKGRKPPFLRLLGPKNGGITILHTSSNISQSTRRNIPEYLNHLLLNLFLFWGCGLLIWSAVVIADICRLLTVGMFFCFRTCFETFLFNAASCSLAVSLLCSCKKWNSWNSRQQLSAGKTRTSEVVSEVSEAFLTTSQ